MRTLSKRPAFLIAVRVLVLLYGAALLQLCGMANCVCAQTVAGDYEEKAVLGKAVVVSTVPCCCKAQSGFEAVSGVQPSCCCVSNNDRLGSDFQAVFFNAKQPLMFKEVSRAVTPSFCVAHTSYGAYPAGYHAEVLPSHVSHHISTTILLL